MTDPDFENMWGGYFLATTVACVVGAVYIWFWSSPDVHAHRNAAIVFACALGNAWFGWDALKRAGAAKGIGEHPATKGQSDVDVA